MTLAEILFVAVIVGTAADVLLALFLLFRDESQGATKTSKRFLLSNWK
jgi:hypothetical protein